MNPTEGMMIRNRQSKEIYLVTQRTTENIYIRNSKGSIGKLSLDEFKEEYEIVTYGLKTEGRAKEPYEAPKVEFISFEDIYRLTEKTIPMRASEIENIPDHLKGKEICAYCWEPLYKHNSKVNRYYNYCPGCGRKVAEK
jgi:hypothetical protein